jgi:hypothetical protein
MSIIRLSLTLVLDNKKNVRIAMLEVFAAHF